MFRLESLAIAVLHFDFEHLNALASERSAYIDCSILLVSCQIMLFIMLTHLPQLTITFHHAVWWMKGSVRENVHLVLDPLQPRQLRS